MMIGASRATCADIGGDGDVGLRQLGSRRGVDIEADHPPAALDEVAGDRASHDAKPDDSNGLVHESLLPGRIAVAGSRGRALILVIKR